MRRLKVLKTGDLYRQEKGREEKKAKINILGAWVIKEACLRPGDYVTVICTPGSIIISKEREHG